MVSRLVEKHIVRKSKREGIPFTGSIDEQLANYVNTLGLDDSKIIFSWLFDGGSSILNAGVLFTGHIIVNAEWAAHLILYPERKTQNAFQQTIGHELAHLENDYKFVEFFTKEKKFVNWVNEVHADFGGAEKCLNGDRGKLLEALNYKREYKGKKDKDSSEHPSWEKRCEYAECFNFDSELIRTLAETVGCHNERLIEKVCKHYAQIIVLK